MTTGRDRAGFAIHTHSRRKNSSSYPYLNPTDIKLLSHPHPIPPGNSYNLVPSITSAGRAFGPGCF